jgi:hypothetical protein
MNAEAPFKIGDVVAVTYPGYTVKIGARPLVVPAEIHKCRVAAIFSRPEVGQIDYEVCPALFNGGYSERRIPVIVSMKMETWNGHHQYLVGKVIAERKRNGTHSTRIEKRTGNRHPANRTMVDTYSAGPKRMASRVSPFLRDDWRSSSEWRSFAFPE